MLLALAIGLTVEALLAVRLWAQLTGQAIDAGALATVFDATKFLVSPFKEFEPSSPIKETGIVEIATLVAMQAYLIATVATMIIIRLVGAIVGFVLRPLAEAVVSEPAPATVSEGAVEAVKLNEANLASN